METEQKPYVYTIDTKDALEEKLAVATKEHIEKYQEQVNAKFFLEEFEKNMRMGTFGEMIKQSNSQKMQLVFEDYVRTNEENWKRWQTLRRKELQTSLDLYANEKILEYLKELVKLQV